ncbi:hypothetical protein [Pseudoalteromonas luteoviolacea]|uniref:hypothetical protein n=1 Tax=Pseudoalteromonas luteoviolacea TaxID=43657 RepID=UPI001B374A2C|nr:hypothetical protein [Pseudoalteromonas luteoviolacea]MBQ4840154.1 hypothetical protein [Pseudoalteromonas luteoviolacea]
MYKSLDEAIQGLLESKKQLRSSIKPPFNDIAIKPIFDCDFCREAILFRFVELSESAYHLYKSNLLVAAIVSVRAAQETIAVVWYVQTKLKSFTNNKDRSKFEKIVERLIFGWSNDEEFPEKINVLTCIDSVDKELGGAFRKHYNMLSEFSHPNYSGTFGAYAQPNHQTKEVVFGSYPRSKEVLERRIETTLIQCISMLHALQSEYESLYSTALDVCIASRN